MSQKTIQAERPINCHHCWSESTCIVEFSYTDAGRICDAKVVRLPQGWQYRPIGELGGQAPYCTSCLAGNLPRA